MRADIRHDIRKDFHFRDRHESDIQLILLCIRDLSGSLNGSLCMLKGQETFF
jgi:hypothetical protein